MSWEEPHRDNSVAFWAKAIFYNFQNGRHFRRAHRFHKLDLNLWFLDIKTNQIIINQMFEWYNNYSYTRKKIKIWIKKFIRCSMRLKQQGPPPKHKIVYFALSQLLVVILRLFKVLIRTLGQGAHIGSNSDVIWSTFIFYCIHNGCYFDNICRFRMICHYFNVIWKIKLILSNVIISIMLMFLYVI